MLDRLDDVAWSTLRDALDNSSTDVPALVRDLASADKRKRSPPATPAASGSERFQKSFAAPRPAMADTLMHARS